MAGQRLVAGGGKSWSGREGGRLRAGGGESGQGSAEESGGGAGRGRAARRGAAGEEEEEEAGGVGGEARSRPSAPAPTWLSRLAVAAPPGGGRRARPVT